MKFDVNKEVTRSLKFKPIPKYNNLCVGKLVEVRVEVNEIATENDDGTPKDWEYAGCEVPNLVFRFENHKIKGVTDEYDRVYEHRESVIGSRTKDGVDMDPSKVVNFYEAMWDRLKHIHEAFQKVANYRDIKSIPDIDETLAPAERAKAFRKFFDAIAKYFNEGTDKKPIFCTAKGEYYPMVMKLVATYESGFRALGFNTFVGEGFIEPLRLQDGMIITKLEIKGSETVELTKGRSIKKVGVATEQSGGLPSAPDIDPSLAAILQQQG